MKTLLFSKQLLGSMSGNKRRRGDTGEALPSVSYKKFCEDIPEHDTSDVASLPEVYTVYRSLCENGLWKVCHLRRKD